jgi:hypothetical protein
MQPPNFMQRRLAIAVSDDRDVGGPVQAVGSNERPDLLEIQSERSEKVGAALNVAEPFYEHVKEKL